MSYAQNSIKCDHSGLSNYDEVIRIDGFLNRISLNNYKLEAIPGDASKRKYYRVFTANERFILMDASLLKQSVEPFIKIGGFLKNLNLSAPMILSSDLENGLLLLEDFGNDSFTSYISRYSTQEESLYKLAVDILVILYHADTEIDLPKHDNAQLDLELMDGFVSWYLKYKITGNVYKKAVEEFFVIFHKLYASLPNLKPVIVLKDYMADNLMYIQKRDNVEKVGLLDFQDAVIGSPTYDLVSLLEDARRDVDGYISDMCKERFLSQIPDIDKKEFEIAYAISAIQKNLRVIGVFHRLNLRDKKPKYLNYLPRMWKYVNANLEHSQLQELKNWFKKYGVRE